MDNNLKLAINIHGELSQLVHPATPESIRASSITNNTVLVVFVFCGFLSSVLLLTSSVLALPVIYQIIAAAILGITFQSLYSANKYLKTSTYNPRHNQGYIINYALGIFSGTILGLFGQEFLTTNMTGEIPGNLKMTPHLLALIGGYSAEAVAQILQRVSETLVTVVRGPEKDINEAKTHKKIINEKSKINNQLSKILSDDPEAMKKSLEKVIKDLANEKLDG